MTDTTSISSHPTIIQGSDDTLAVLNVSQIDPPVNRVVYQTPRITDVSVTLESSSGHINPDYNVFVDPLGFAENVVFGEEIPLDPINPRAQFEIEEPQPTSSTPLDRVQRVLTRARHFYGRHIQQVPTCLLYTSDAADE